MSDLPEMLYSVAVVTGERGPELFRYRTDGETPKSEEVYIIGENGIRRRVPKRKLGVAYFGSISEAVEHFVEQRESSLADAKLAVKHREDELRLVKARALEWDGLA